MASCCSAWSLRSQLELLYDELLGVSVRSIVRWCREFGFVPEAPLPARLTPTLTASELEASRKLAAEASRRFPRAPTPRIASVQPTVKSSTQYCASCGRIHIPLDQGRSLEQRCRRQARSRPTATAPTLDYMVGAVRVRNNEPRRHADVEVVSALTRRGTLSTDDSSWLRQGAAQVGVALPQAGDAPSDGALSDAVERLLMAAVRGFASRLVNAVVNSPKLQNSSKSGRTASVKGNLIRAAQGMNSTFASVEVLVPRHVLNAITSQEEFSWLTPSGV